LRPLESSKMLALTKQVPYNYRFKIIDAKIAYRCWFRATCFNAHQEAKDDPAADIDHEPVQSVLLQHASQVGLNPRGRNTWDEFFSYSGWVKPQVWTSGPGTPLVRLYAPTWRIHFMIWWRQRAIHEVLWRIWVECLSFVCFKDVCLFERWRSYILFYGVTEQEI